MSALFNTKLKPLEVLIVSIDLAEVEPILTELGKAGFNPIWQLVETAEEFRQHLDPQLDLILADFSLSQISCTEGFDILSNAKLDIPVIIVTGAEEEVALGWLENGAVDYHLKDRLLRLGPSVKKALDEKRIREENKNTLEALRESEQRYRGVAETAVTGLSIVDANECITYANPSLADLLGYSTEELVGMPLTQVIPPEHYSRILEETENRKLGLTTQYESKMIRKDGEARIVIISASPLTADLGDYEGSHAVITDITDRVKVEKDLILSEEKQRLMIEKSPLGFSSTDLEGNVMNVSPAFCLMLGYSQRELQSKHFEQYTHPDDIEENNRLYQKLVEGEIEYFDLEKRFIHKNGNIVHALIRSQMVRNYEGEPLFEYAIIEDITEKKLSTEKNHHLHLMLQTISKINHLLVEDNSKNSLINKTCRILTEQRGYHNAWIVLFNENGQYLDFAESGLGDEFEPLKEKLKDGNIPYCGKHALNDLGLMLVTEPESECEDCSLAKNYFDRSGFSYPLKFGEKVYGLLTVSAPEFLLAQDQEKQLFIEIGTDVGYALHNIELKKRSQEADDQLRLQSLALEAAANAILITDAEGSIQWANPAFTSLTGYSLQETKGENPRLLKSGRHSSKFYKSLWQTIKTGEIWQGEVLNKRKNGELYIEEMTIAPLLNENEEISNYIAIKQDVTERSQTEREIRQRTEELVLINKINDATNQGMDLPKILELLTEQSKKIFNCKAASVYLYNQDRNLLEMQSPAYKSGLAGKIESLIGITIPDIQLPVEEGSLTHELLMADSPRLINDSVIIQEWMLEFTNTEGLPKKARSAVRKLIPQIHKLIDVNSVITIPMVSSGKLVGLMDFSRSESFTEEDTERVAGIVGQITSAITKLQTENEKLRSWRLIEFLSQAAPVVQNASTADEIFSAIGEQVVEMGFNVTVFSITDDKKNLAVTYHNLSSQVQKIEKLTGLSAVNYSFPIKPGGFFHEIISGGKTAISHLEVDPISEALPELVKPLSGKIMDLFKGQQSIIAPMAFNGEITGLISISGSDLSESDKPAVTTFANQAAIALEKTRLYNETQELARFNEGIVQNMIEGIVLENAEGYFSFINPAGKQLLGYPGDELTGMHWRDVVPQDHHPIIRDANERRQKGESDRYETDLLRKDGRRLSVIVSSSPLFDRENKINGTLVVFTDITDRKKAELEIRQNVKRLDALRIIDQAIISSFELGFSLNIILEQMLAQLEIDAAAVLSYKADLQTLQFTNGRGFQTAALQQTDLRLGEGYAGRAALKREHVFIEDLNKDAGRIHESPLFAGENFLAYYGVPLVAKGKLVGVLELFNRSALDPNPEWVNYLKLLASQTALAIDNSMLFNDLQTTNVDLTLAYDATIEGWARALELKDMETEGHSRRVVEMTMDLARRMEVSGERLAFIRRGALLHDIGKMGIPDSILQKPGKLSDEEWQIMKKHPVYAYDWLSRIQYLQPALDIPYAHHERWDGTGYPRGLKGEQIPLEARIFAIVDVWDALNSDRPYRKAWPREKALNHITEQSGKHFDPRVVEVFMEIIKMDVEMKRKPEKKDG